MKFSVGDPVYIRSNDEEGIIEEFIGKDMASVLVDKKNYHVFLEDIEHPYLRWFLNTPKNTKSKKNYIDQLSAEKSPVRSSGLPEGIYLILMPVYKLEGFEEVVEKLKIYFYNETHHHYQFEYLVKVRNENLFSIDSELEKGGQFYLHDIDFEKMAMNPLFSFRFIDKNKPEHDNEGSFSMKPKKVFEKMDQIKYANHPFFHFLLFEKLKPRIQKPIVVPALRKNIVPKNKASHFDFETALKKSSHEIDLHIEKLVDDHRKLSAAEILRIQLMECQRALDLAKATHQQTLIIIHGIGKGVLKNEINSLLNQTSDIKNYVNEYDVRYGYGATKVIFRQ